MRYSLRLYREARRALSEALRALARADGRRIAIYGTGEAAEFAYLTLRDLGLEPSDGILAELEAREVLRDRLIPLRTPGT